MIFNIIIRDNAIVAKFDAILTQCLKESYPISPQRARSSSHSRTEVLPHELSSLSKSLHSVPHPISNEIGALHSSRRIRACASHRLHIRPRIEESAPRDVWVGWTTTVVGMPHLTCWWSTCVIPRH